MAKKLGPYSSLRFDTIRECDRRTDGRTSLLWLYQRLHSLLCYRAGKNIKKYAPINPIGPAVAELSSQKLKVPELTQLKMRGAGTPFRRVPPYFDPCSLCRSDVRPRSNFRVSLTTRAAALSTRCSLSVIDCDSERIIGQYLMKSCAE